MIRLWVSLNRFDFLNLDNTCVLRLTSKVIIKLSGFFTREKGGRISLILLHRYGMVLDGTLFSTTITFVEFSIEFQSNNLIYDKGYSKRQQVIYCLIILLREGYRKITRKLNNGVFKTHRGK